VGQRVTTASSLVTVTVSIGLAAFTREDIDPQAVVRRADEALYRAKQAGRNCVRVAAEAAG
jgi:diguanylate cyclase (GGDEF)-like protein